MNPRSVLVPFLAAAPLLALTLPRDTVRFTPVSDALLTKAFTTTLDLELADVSALFNGEDEGMPEIQIETEWKRTVTVTDGFLATRAGAPDHLRRKFDELEQTLEYACSVNGKGVEFDASGTSTGHSGLADAVVAFQRDEGDDEYERTFVDMEGDDDLLEGLVEDMDLRALLPEDEVDEDEEWEIDPEAFALILEPGGDLAFVMEVERLELPRMVGVVGPLSLVLVPPGEMLGETDGEVTGRYRGAREADGVRLAVIEVHAEIESVRDLTEALNAELQETLPPGAEIQVNTADLTFTYEGRGELLWNLDAGRLHAWDLTGEVSVTLDREVEGTMGSDAGTIETSVEMTGTLTQSVTVD